MSNLAHRSLIIAGLAASSALAQTTSDRLLWSFETTDRAIRQYVTVADDGTIYTADALSTFALSPAGDLLWSTSPASSDGAGGRPITIGDDGTIYTGGGDTIVAIDPDGRTRWSFVLTEPLDIAAGPGVGPDGKIYAFQENVARGGLGAFALDADGNLVWSADGDPPIQPVTALSNSEIVFGPNRLHAGVVGLRSGGSPTLYGFDLDGDQIWTSRDLDVQTIDFPVIDPTNRVITTWGQTGVRALSPDGQQEWFAIHPSGASVLLRPAIGASGVIYTGDFIGLNLWAVNPDGTTRWVRPREPGTLVGLAVSPDERVLVAFGNGGFGQPSWVRGYSAADGTELWTADLQSEGGLNQLATTYRAGFAPDSSAVYFTTQFAGAGVGFGYVVALDITDDSCRADLDGDGELTIFDFLTFQNLFDAGDLAADFDGDGSLTIFDFLAFQNEFDAGCD